MIFPIILLFLVESATWTNISCFSLVEKINFHADTKSQYHRHDDNSILDEIRKREMREKISRSRRDLTVPLSSTESNVRVAYERAMNQTISDYYAQRKAVMERYYARQREILEKFERKTIESPRSTKKPIEKRMRTFDTTKSPIETTMRIFDATTETRETTIESTTSVAKIMDNEENENDLPKSIILDESETSKSENNNSTGAWTYRTNNWNPRDLGNGTDIDFVAESSNTVEVDGYYRLGDFKGSEDEKVVYQHNLGLGLKGPSQLDADFEVILEGPFAITTIEAFPYANTRANFTWISGGPGTNSVKLHLKGYENEGFSYTVKVWGVPI